MSGCWKRALEDGRGRVDRRIKVRSTSWLDGWTSLGGCVIFDNNNAVALGVADVDGDADTGAGASLEFQFQSQSQESL